MKSFSHLALGTVQFGMSYGIANTHGQINSLEAEKIIQQAKSAGLDTLDTAISYGNAELLLGQIGVKQWKVVSKLPQIPESVNVSKWVSNQITESLGNLNIPTLHGLLLHQPAKLLGPDGDAIFNALLKAKAAGLANKVGISSYSSEEIDQIMQRYPLDIVQAPLNIFDRRLLTSGCIERMNDAGVEFHARSIFLQGLLLLEKQNRPQSFSAWNSVWNNWHDWLVEMQITPLQACLGFVAIQEKVSRLVIGVDTCEHLNEILSTYAQLKDIEFPAYLEVQDPNLLNPANWSLH